MYQTTLFEKEESVYVNDYSIRRIERYEALPFILELHYAKRVPSAIQYTFGLFHTKKLVGIITYGIPASNQLCEGIAGIENKKLVIELSRLALRDNKQNEASILIGASFKLLPKPLIIVSYADTKQKHQGIVYQATNFLFTGTTSERTDASAGDGKHSRHHLGDLTQRVVRSPKHRYVYILGSKRDKKKLQKQLKYKIQPYPK